MPMLRWLAEALKDARQEAGLVQGDVSDMLPAFRGSRSHPATISDFERGQGWPRNPDVMVDAYARALRRESFELWAAGLSRWAAAGGAGSEEARAVLAAFAAEIPGLVEAAQHGESHRPARPKRSRAASPRK